MSGTFYQIIFRSVTVSSAAVLLATFPDGFESNARGTFIPASLPIDTVRKDTLEDDTKRSGKHTLLRWQDYYRNRFADPRPATSLYLDDPRNISTDLSLDTTGKIVVKEEIVTPSGKLDFRPAENISMDEYNAIQNDRAVGSLMKDYASRQDGKSAMGAKGLLPKLDLPPALEKFLGNNLADFKPTGFVSLDLGVINQFIDNPAVPIRQRKNTSFKFDEQININFNAKIGDKLGFLTNFDTKASFNFENALRLNYKAPEESLIRKIEAGNFSWAINSQLIPGVQNLFGVKTEFQFGRLNATFVASQQRSSKERIVLKGGAQSREFEIRVDNYDENRHFFLSQYFRDQYEKSLKSIPNVTSGITVTRLEVYVTNRTANTQTLRNIVGFADLAEPKPYNTSNSLMTPINAASPAANDANGLFAAIANNKDLRHVDQTNTVLTDNFKLVKNQDYELLRGAKKLIAESEYKFDPQLGHITLTTQLRNDEVLAVAYEYTLNGRSYKVGELTEDYQNRKDDEVILLKLLKSSTIRNNTNLPMWDLMMKNIYSLGANQIEKQGFQLRIIYKDDRTGMDNPNLQEGRNFQNIPLLRFMGLDRLNSAGDLQPDGNFDYIENITIDARNGLIRFPVLEPFGDNLAKSFDTDEDGLRSKYVFNELYTLTKIDAEQVNEKNKFYLKGSYQSSGGQDIQLPYGVSEESVTVTAGGVALSRGQDFVVEAQIGRVRLVNPSVMNSGREIVIEYERPDMFNNQIRTLLGTRLDYVVNKDFSIGMTAMRHRETPAGFLTRVSIGNEPTNNSILGFDVNLRKDLPFLTRWLDKLPFLQTKEMSSIQFRGEVAKIFPGVAPRVNNRALVDDFEATRTVYDLTRQPTKWKVASTPASFQDSTTSTGLKYGYKRAKISAYTVDNIFGYTGLGGYSQPPSNLTDADYQNYYQRLFTTQQIFPGRSVPPLNLPQTILDVAYFPHERGMYNFNPDLDLDGRLRNPRENFGAISRAITSDIDFDNANIETIDFWMMDPFLPGEKGKVLDGVIDESNTTGGKLVFNLGDISEDMIPDERYNFENGLPIGSDTVVGTDIEFTKWGKVTKKQYLINAFSNQPGARAKQDVGLDGLTDAEERTFFKSYIDGLEAKVSPEALAKIKADPSGDNFQFYLGAELDAQQLSILPRYKGYMGMEGNSPESTGGTTVTPASTNLPDGEDLNVDNTINNNESYYEYTIDLQPNGLKVGTGFIVDKTEADGTTWYLFRVPIKEYNRIQGQMNGFKSIRFIRMFLTDFQQPVVLRFAELQMVGQQYRKYTADLSDPGLQEVPEPYDAKFTVGTVSIEENSQGNSNTSVKKYVYAVPPGWQRDQDYTQPTQNFQLNEQSMSLCVTQLRDNDSRAVYKNVNLDLLFRKRLRMYIHMHNETTSSAGDIGAFLRLGTDVTQNYYEIEVNNLQPTEPNVSQPEAVWPVENELNIAFSDLINAKAKRNQDAPNSLTVPFRYVTSDGRYTIRVVGNPDLSTVRVVMIGVRNIKSADEQAKSFCIWVDEMHVEGFDETSGQAGVAQLNAKLADFATVTASGRFTTFGFGGVEQKIGERSRDNTIEYGIASNIAVDKLLPQQWGLSIPLYLSYDKRRISPHFDPRDPDTDLETSLLKYKGAADSARIYRRMVEDNQISRGINLSNLRKMRVKPGAKSHFYDIENFSFTYAFNDTRRTNILIDEYTQIRYKGGLAYAFSSQPKAFEPFKKWKNQSPFLALIKEFNLTLMPTSIAFRTDVDRSFTKTQLRNSDLTIAGVEPLFEKYFWFNRYYDVNWNLTRRAIVSYNSVARAIVDEPRGDLNTQEKRDSLWSNFKKLGRIKNFDQNIRLTYRLPLEKIPLTDWMTADYNHTIGYHYQANTYGAMDSNGELFGDIIRNSRERGISGRVDFVALYNKIKYLKFANSPRVERKNFARSPGDVEEMERVPNNLLKSATRLVMTVRGINVSYSVLETTALPGYLRAPQYFGLDNANAPGLGFVLGKQDYDFQKKAAEKGWITRSTELNQPFQQTIQKKFDMTTSLEPFRDFTMDIKTTFNRQDAYQEFYRPEAVDKPFITQSPLRNGQFSMTFWSFKTAFAKVQRDNSSPIFDRFLEYRSTMMERLNQLNPYKDNSVSYNENSQDVLMAAFFAAYSGKDKNSLRVNPFLRFPMPNWVVRYNGLSKLAMFKRLFSSFIINHSYSSLYSVGNYTSSLGYGADYVNLAVMDYRLSNLSNGAGLYLPVFAMSTITMAEKFSPLIGVNFITVGRVTGRMEYNRDRSIALNLSNSQVQELFNQDITVSIGFTKNNVPIPFKINGKKRKLKNDLTAQLTMAFRDTRSIQRKFDGTNTPTAGNINFQLRPTVNYIVSNRLSLQFYFDRTFNDPLVSNSFYRRTTAGGIQVKFNLAE